MMSNYGMIHLSKSNFIKLRIICISNNRLTYESIIYIIRVNWLYLIKINLCR